MNFKSLLLNLVLYSIFFLSLHFVYRKFRQKQDIMDTVDLINLKGFSVVGSSRCSWSIRQLADLGVTFDTDKFKVVDCEKDAAICGTLGIQSFPTWIGPEGILYPGYKPVQDLKRMIVTV